MPVHFGELVVKNSENYYDVLVSREFNVRDELTDLVYSICHQSNCDLQDAWIFVNFNRYSMRRQGFKIHISSVVTDAMEVASLTMRFLKSHEVSFKIVCNLKVLSIINDAHYPVPGANKFITIYPESDEQFKMLVRELFELLRSYSGPRIHSDFQCAGDSLVHYRYGAFQGITKFDKEKGKTIYCLVDDKGELVEDKRLPYFYTPHWVELPFNIETDSNFIFSSPNLSTTSLARYDFKKIISESNKGNIYLVVDKDSGLQYVIKEARKYVLYGGKLATELLKNEFTVLKHIEDIGLTPKAYELHDINGDLFLVEDYIEGDSLSDQLYSLENQVKDNLARQIFRLVVSLHSRNLQINDLSPNNLILCKDGQLKLLDFEAAHLNTGDSHAVFLATPGYYNPEESRISFYSQDWFALATCLLTLYTKSKPQLILDMHTAKYQTRSIIQKVIDAVGQVYESGIVSDYGMSLIVIALVKSSGNFESLQELIKLVEHKVDINTTHPSLDVTALSNDFFKNLNYSLLSRHKEKKRLLDSGGFGNSTPELNIQHGLAGIVLLALAMSPHCEEANVTLDVACDIFENYDYSTINSEYAHSLLFGSVGITFAILKLASYKKNKDLLDIALALFGSIGIDTDEDDFALGLTGYSYVAFKIYEQMKDASYLSLATKTILQVAERFNSPVEFGKKQSGYSHFSSKKITSVCGFAHGMAGWIFVADEIYRTCSDERLGYFLEIGKSYLIQTTKMRLSNFKLVDPIQDLSWCNGMAGIGYCLTRLYRSNPNRELLDLLKDISNVLLDNMWVNSNCLCHGNSSSLLFLSSAYEVTQDPLFKEAVGRVAGCVYNGRYITEDAIEFTDETQITSRFDFGTGTAGILYGLSRAKLLVGDLGDY